MSLAAGPVFGTPGQHAMIAATALTLGLTVASRSVRDFAKFGVDLLDPFETPHT